MVNDIRLLLALPLCGVSSKFLCRRRRRRRSPPSSLSSHVHWK